MKSDAETPTGYAIRLIREEERRECISLAIRAIHECDLPYSQISLEIKRCMAYAVSEALRARR